MSPEFIGIIVFGTIQLVGLPILGSMMRDVSRTTREVSVSTRIHFLHSRRIEEVLQELREVPHS
jgi:hypothetical protein